MPKMPAMRIYSMLLACRDRPIKTMDLLTHFKQARNSVSVPPGAVLFAEGDPATNMYVLMDGIAEVCVGGEVVEPAEPPAILGEMALVDTSVRSATVVT